MGEITVRLATYADYQAVMNINDNIYAGFDYLFSMYHEFCHDSNTFCFVAELEREVVSLL